MWRHLTFGWRYIIYMQDFSWDEEREKSHRGGGLYKENRAEVLENSHPGSFKNDVILPAL